MDSKRSELLALQDRLVRLQSVRTDLALNLPVSIPLPYGEEYPYSKAMKLRLRSSAQGREICDTCVRPPPNRTVYEAESPPPYRSSASLSGSSLIRSGEISDAPTERPPNLLRRIMRWFTRKRSHHTNDS